MDEYTGELEELVATGDLGYDTYDRATIIEKLGASQRLYIEGGFNFTKLCDQRSLLSFTELRIRLL